eukprot:COSAG01_NODE_39152_length_480_cov_1.104987_1_plen_46_part_10
MRARAVSFGGWICLLGRARDIQHTRALARTFTLLTHKGNFHRTEQP